RVTQGEETASPRAHVRELLSQVHLKRVVVRLADVLKLIQVAVNAVIGIRIQYSPVGSEDERIDVYQAGQLVRRVPDISNLQRKAGSELLLDGQIVLEHIRGAKLGVDYIYAASAEGQESGV